MIKMKTKYDFFGIVSDKGFRSTFALLVLTMLVGLTLSSFVFAATEPDPSMDVQCVLATLICRVFQLVFYIAGAIAALVIVVAGIKWIGSGDDPSARGQAKSTVVHAVIGLVIVLIAVFLVSWIVAGVTGASMANPISFISGACDPAEICLIQ